MLMTQFTDNKRLQGTEGGWVLRGLGWKAEGCMLYMQFENRHFANVFFLKNRSVDKKGIASWGECCVQIFKAIYSAGTRDMGLKKQLTLTVWNCVICFLFLG